MSDGCQDTPNEQLAASAAGDAIPRMVSKSRWQAVDMTLAFGAACLLAPLLLSVAMLALLSQGRPLFHRVESTGRNGRRFHKLTFRASRVDTSFGRVLRSTNTSELPLLWNILRGDMSFAALRAKDDAELVSADADLADRSDQLATRRG
jgi:lipopolysaccharide/colanic/teichoic acid biosynthesis glycosyltransferase